MMDNNFDYDEYERQFRELKHFLLDFALPLINSKIDYKSSAFDLDDFIENWMKKRFFPRLPLEPPK